MMNFDLMKFFDPALMQNMSGFNSFSMDFKTFTESQRKNFQALTEAQQQAIESMQTIAQKQTDIISQLVQDNSTLAREVLSVGTPEQKMAKQTDMTRKNYEKSISSLREIGEILNKSQQKTADIINKRISASLDEAKTLLEQSEKPVTKKAA